MLNQFLFSDFYNDLYFRSNCFISLPLPFPFIFLPPSHPHKIWHKRIFRQYYNRMGNTSRSVLDYDLSSSFSPSNWSHQPFQSHQNILRNHQTRQLAEVIQLSSIPSIQDMDIYTFRMIQNDLVKIYHLVVENLRDFCTDSQYARLVVEFIPLRLGAVREMDREEALTVLCAAFRAFHIIEIKFGPLVPSEELIGFNYSGKTKVWLNKDHWINQPQHNYHNAIQATKLSLSQRIALLYQMVQSKTKYVLMTPNAKQQLLSPTITYLNAIKIIQKFAYYQKLSLRKYLRLFPPIKIQQQPQQLLQYSHIRNKSYHTQLACETNPTINNTYNISTLSKETSGNLRRIYSLNSIHRQSNKTSVYVPTKPYVMRQDQRWERESYAHNSVITDNSNKDSLCPSSAKFKHCNQVVNLSNYQQRIQGKQGNVAAVSKEVKFDVKEDDKNVTISQSKLIQEDQKVAYNPIIAEDPQPIQNQRKFSIIDKIRCESNDFAYQTDKQLLSPTFLQPQNSNFQMPSFAPSQQVLRQKLSSPIKQSEIFEVRVNKQQNSASKNKGFEEFNQIPQQITQQFLKKNNSQGSEQSRRFSIQNRGKKLQLPPQLALLQGGLLNYCVPVESKLHMATNRQHSIIDQKQHKKQQSSFKRAPVQQQSIENYIRQKYHIPKPEEKIEHIQKQMSKHKVQRIQSKYVSLPVQSNSIKKRAKQETSLNNLQEQDFLDVNFLEKSLDMRYNSIQSKNKIQMKKKEIEDNDALNVAKLEEGLLKFSQSQLSQKNTEKNMKSKEKESKVEISQFDLEQKDRKINFSSSHPNFISAFDSYKIEYSTGFDSYNKQKHQKPKKQAPYREYLTHQYSFQQHNNKSREQQLLQRAIMEKRQELDNKLGNISTSRKGQRRISYDELRKLLWN